MYVLCIYVHVYIGIMYICACIYRETYSYMYICMYYVYMSVCICDETVCFMWSDMSYIISYIFFFLCPTLYHIFFLCGLICPSLYHIFSAVYFLIFSYKSHSLNLYSIYGIYTYVPAYIDFISL